MLQTPAKPEPPVIPIAPTEERWRAMTPAERERFLVSVNEVLSDPVFAMAEGRPHQKAKSRAIDMLSRHFRAMGKHIYLAEELSVIYPGAAGFVPDVMAVLDVEEPEDDQRMAWVVVDEGKGLDWVLEVLWAGDRKKDLEHNVERYASLGIPEYFVYDQRQQRILGYRLPPGARGGSTGVTSRFDGEAVSEERAERTSVREHAPEEPTKPANRAVACGAPSKRYQPILPRAGLYRSNVLGVDLAVVERSLRFFQGTAELYDTEHLIRRLEDIVANLQERAEQAARDIEQAAHDIEQAERNAEQSRAGVREAILTVLRARGVTCSAEGLGRLEACVDPGVLNQWLMRALQATSEAEVFGA